MTRRALIGIIGFVVAAVALWWVLFVALPQWTRRAPADPASTTVPDPAAAEQRKITATLFYVSEDGMALIPVQREVPFGEPVVEQARHLVEAQLADPPEPLVSAVPSGTRLRAVYLTEQGDLFVDLSAEVTSNHPGGALDELFTVYTFVNALTVSLPAIQRVQLLVDGKEADTLAGHVDLRHPLSRNTTWVRSENPS